MADGPLARLFWRVTDEFDYLVTLTRLRILDALAGPEPETPADRRRQEDRERLRRAFPEIEPRGAGVPRPLIGSRPVRLILQLDNPQPQLLDRSWLGSHL
jgi:hypothetical protein